MAIEIKELKIKINVSDNSGSFMSSSINQKKELDERKLKQEIVKECVARVMELLEEKLER